MKKHLKIIKFIKKKLKDKNALYYAINNNLSIEEVCKKRRIKLVQPL